MDELKTWVESHHPLLSVREQCRILNINRSNLYYIPQEKAYSDEQLSLMRLVDEIYTRYPFFGTRQMSDYISMHHYSAKRHEIRFVYEKLGLQSTAPGPHTSRPHPLHSIYPYLLRNLSVTRPHQVWSADITYLRLHKGFAYLIAIIDWYSRYVLDWQISNTLESEFCIETLQRVLQSDQCDIFNTDQGAQFTSSGFTQLLLNHEIKISMDGKGRALDNIFVERLWRTVKYECVYLQEWENIAAIKTALQKYFYFYNHERPHQSLGGQTPAMAHAKLVH